MFKRKNQQRGFTLTELAIVLGIVGLILGAIWSAASSVYANNRTATATRQFLAIANGARAVFPHGNIPAAELATLLINNGVVPGDMLAPCAGGQYGGGYSGTVNGASVCAYSIWNTQIAIQSQEGWGGAPASTSAFEILIGNLTASQCASFLPAFVQAAAGNGLTFAYSDATGGGAVDQNTSITAFQNCSGQVALQFTL